MEGGEFAISWSIASPEGLTWVVDDRGVDGMIVVMAGGGATATTDGFDAAVGEEAELDTLVDVEGVEVDADVEDEGAEEEDEEGGGGGATGFWDLTVALLLPCFNELEGFDELDEEACCVESCCCLEG